MSVSQAPSGRTRALPPRARSKRLGQTHRKMQVQSCLWLQYSNMAAICWLVNIHRCCLPPAPMYSGQCPHHFLPPNQISPRTPKPLPMKKVPPGTAGESRSCYRWLLFWWVRALKERLRNAFWKMYSLPTLLAYKCCLLGTWHLYPSEAILPLSAPHFFAGVGHRCKPQQLHSLLTLLPTLPGSAPWTSSLPSAYPEFPQTRN